MSRYYFDYAAATPIDEDVVRAMESARTTFANPASLYAEGRAARELLDAARKRIAAVLGAQSREIVFTSGATESDNLAILGALTAAGEPQARVITAPTEHAAVRACTQVARASGYDVQEVEVAESGMINVETVRKRVTDTTVLLTLAIATSEIGTFQPIGEIGQLVREVRVDRQKRGIATPIILHTDASAALGYLPLPVDRLGVDLMTLSSSKTYGPVGIGALYVRRGTPLTPLIIGGRQEASLRSGTPAVELAVGFATATEKAEAMRKQEVTRLQVLHDELWMGLKAISGIQLNGHKKKHLAGMLNVSFAGFDGENLVLALDAAGFAVATGAACAESSDEPSHVLLALGRTRAEAQGSLRISLGRTTTSEEVQALISAIRKIVVQ
ncbi:MAG: cysteine desulfurase [Patescibacteria group bacterium]|nr:cysteine desulfurase [Patescibacteria group bacterium]